MTEQALVETTSQVRIVFELSHTEALLRGPVALEVGRVL